MHIFKTTHSRKHFSQANRVAGQATCRSQSMNPQTQDHPQLPNENNQADWVTERWNLLWGVERSVKYHDRRRGFFLVCHRLVLGTGIMVAATGVAVAHDVLLPQWLTTASLIAGTAFLLDLIADFSGAATLHTDLKNRFADLEREIVKADQGTDLRPMIDRRLEIQKDEPRIMRALDLLCHNELARAKGIADTYGIPWYKQMTANFFAWQDI